MNNSSGVMIWFSLLIMIFADISFRGYMVVYDNAKQKIGWKRADCDMSSRRLRKKNSFIPDTML